MGWDVVVPVPSWRDDCGRLRRGIQPHRQRALPWADDSRLSPSPTNGFARQRGRAAWLETADQQFDGPGWQKIDCIRQMELKIRLRILAGVYAPQFVKRMGGPGLSDPEHQIDCSGAARPDSPREREAPHTATSQPTTCPPAAGEFSLRLFPGSMMAATSQVLACLRPHIASVRVTGRIRRVNPARGRNGLHAWTSWAQQFGRIGRTNHAEISEAIAEEEGAAEEGN